jgi:hypothetical protein
MIAPPVVADGGDATLVQTKFRATSSGVVVKVRRACRGMVRVWRAPNMRPYPVRKALATIREIDETKSVDVEYEERPVVRSRGKASGLSHLPIKATTDSSAPGKDATGRAGKSNERLV